MQFRATEFLVAIVALTGIFFSYQPSADACSQPLEYRTVLEQDNTPECLKLYGTTEYDGDRSPVLTIDNECEQSVEFDKLECETCQEDADVEPGKSGDVDLVRADMEDGETLRQTYAWTMGDDEGLVETAVTHRDVSDASCPEPQPGVGVGPRHACAASASVTGTAGGPLDRRLMLVAFLLLASAIGLRRQIR